MQPKTDVEMARLRVKKVTRTLIRLRHSLAADEEINQRVPELVTQFDEALQKGLLMDIAAGMSDIFGKDDEPV